MRVVKYKTFNNLNKFLQWQRKHEDDIDKTIGIKGITPHCLSANKKTDNKGCTIVYWEDEKTELKLVKD